ncbi:MAG: DUF4198 domain-containing protein [Sphingomicrobium sp.]|nr:DUF4198 domain-containing protein [Sphingomonadales bacterium]
MRPFIAAALALAFSGIAAAHDFWIQPQSFWLMPKAQTSLAILVGHGPARQHWVLRLNRVVRLISIGPGGRRTDHSGALQQGTYAPDAQIGFATPGTYVVAFENTSSINSLPADRFNDYLRSEGIRPAIEWRQRTNASGQPGRESYSRRAKALVQVAAAGRVAQPQVIRPLGLTLEIVPEINPYQPGTARSLPVRVIYQGHPLAGAFVKLNDLQHDEKPIETHITDGSGRALFQLPRSGQWQMNVVWTRPVHTDPDFDFETVFSSLSFGFPSAPIAS